VLDACLPGDSPKSPMPFGSVPIRDRSSTSPIHGGKVGLQCLSAASRFGTYQKRFISLGNLRSLQCLSAASRFGTMGGKKSTVSSTGCLQCLSAASRFGTSPSVSGCAAGRKSALRSEVVFWEDESWSNATAARKQNECNLLMIRPLRREVRGCLLLALSDPCPPPRGVHPCEIH
jgi:hypothetical protein